MRGVCPHDTGVSARRHDLGSRLGTRCADHKILWSWPSPVPLGHKMCPGLHHRNYVGVNALGEVFAPLGGDRRRAWADGATGTSRHGGAGLEPHRREQSPPPIRMPQTPTQESSSCQPRPNQTPATIRSPAPLTVGPGGTLGNRACGMEGVQPCEFPVDDGWPAQGLSTAPPRRPGAGANRRAAVRTGGRRLGAGQLRGASPDQTPTVRPSPGLRGVVGVVAARSVAWGTSRAARSSAGRTAPQSPRPRHRRLLSPRRRRRERRWAPTSPSATRRGSPRPGCRSRGGPRRRRAGR